MKSSHSLAALLVAVLLSGCGTVSLATLEEPVRTPVAKPTQPDAEGWISVPEEPDQPAPEDQLSHLEAEIRGWMGTPYRYGGNDKSGVDCSAFVQNVFAEALGLALPRTTAQQKESGTRVTRAALEPADLVFFHTPKRTDHVGIYLGDGQFAHASSSRGVMVSNLSERYWDDAFVFARRPVESAPRAVRMLAQEPVPVEVSEQAPRKAPSKKANSRRRTGW
ncbi:MAG: C40 family peptidase [Rhodothermales bacterium]|nr:C40 family peptidase [Rhodothermales bacterium]MBO6778152.1 C40 family peptidase [Rhodothermales bacterium]